MTERMKNKVCLVTGGASGIGEAIVRKFVDEGACVVICDVNDARGNQLAAEITNCKFSHLNVSDLENWKSVVQSVINKKGYIDVLVNCAAVSQSGLPMEQMDLERDWNTLINIDLTGPFYGMYTVIPYMKEHGGSIVNISSVASLVAQCGVTGYTAAKGGINALTRAAAVDYAPYYIRCNAVCPTTTITPNVERIFKEMQGVEDNLKKDCVLPRFGKPSDIANAVTYLASDEAGYVTGQVLAVDGGFTVR